MTVEKPLIDHRAALQPAYQANNTSEPSSELNEYTGQLYSFDMQFHSYMYYQVQMSEKPCAIPKGSPLPKQPVGYSTFCCFMAFSSC